ncbi:MAG: T9SS C-terminal target domain-containing protein, partial [Bacteroidota bacterium]|nr:T9SS C-terminal target domain-containing protein [Bacteroidota bacterium]
MKKYILRIILPLIFTSCSKDNQDKIPTNPNIIWQKNIGSYTRSDVLGDMVPTLDSGYIISSFSNGGGGDKREPEYGRGDYWIIKIDAHGQIEWENTIGGISADIHPSTLASSDNGYVVFGISSSDISVDKTENSYGYGDYWVVKLDENGNVVWDKTYGGVGQELPGKIIENSECYLLLCSSNYPISGNKTLSKNFIEKFDLWLVQIN